MIGIIIFIAVLAVLIGLYLKIFTDSVPVNTLGAGFWLNGFYGDVLKQGFVWFKLPGAKIITHSTEPRVKKKVEQTVRLEAASGPIAVVKISIILGLDPRTSDLEHFETFHREETALESSALEHITRWLDDRIGGENNPNANGTKKAIETEAKAELGCFLARKFGSIKVALAEFKIDLDEDVREAMEEQRKQELKNEAKRKQHQFYQEEENKLIERSNGAMPMETAARIILAREDKANFDENNLNIKIVGLENMQSIDSSVIPLLISKLTNQQQGKDDRKKGKKNEK